ncbi:MAG: RHS repeat-associated core domain-containing protein, partial [Bacteroidales bacterium]|nr:RHS repeat-associated core domain-containing protein [Bacteroidales bacterium]
STAYVTDNNAIITQGFLYAPFGEITTEYNANFGNNVLPKYSFNAKELDEETGMYYYEARYYKPPVFTSRDAMFEKYFWMTPYAYCANNPVKYVDPDGEELIGALIGAAVKATIEIKSQTLSSGLANLENGKGFFENWGKNIDWMDVGVSAAEGFLDGAFPGMGKVGKIVIEGASMAVRSTMDVSGSESNGGKITFKSVFNSGERHKTWGEAGIDMCGEIISYGIVKAAGMDDVPFTRSSVAGCMIEAGFKGGFSGAFSIPSELLRRNYLQKLENSTNSNERVGIITPGPLEKVEP